jgi:Mg2+/Co2+ transporter CorB
MKLLLLLPVAASAFSSAETAFFALRRVDFLKRRKRNRLAGAIEKMLESPGKLIATIFVGNEIANVAISSVIAAFLIREFPAHGELLALLLGTLGILILGDILRSASPGPAPAPGRSSSSARSAVSPGSWPRCGSSWRRRPPASSA